MSDTPSNDNNPPFPGMTDKVLAQFAADLAAPLPCQYDFEFLSAYLDNTVDFETTDANLIAQRIQTFEQHLPNCSPCNSQLGLFSETIHAYRSFGYNCEKQLASWSITDKIMALVSQPVISLLDETIEIPQAGCGLYTAVQFSSFIDKTLVAKDETSLKNHSDECLPCEEFLVGLEKTHASLTGFYETAQPTVESLWPRVEAKLNAPDNVVEFRPRQKRWIPAAAFGIAAAMMLFVFSNQLMPQPNAPQVASSEATNSASYDGMLASGNDSMIYSSPEAYLFSQDAEWIPDDLLTTNKSKDVSAFALRD